MHLRLKFSRFLVAHCATHRYTGAKDLLYGAGKLSCTAAIPHYSCNLDDLIEVQVSTVPDILFLQTSIPAVRTPLMRTLTPE